GISGALEASLSFHRTQPMLNSSGMPLTATRALPVPWCYCRQRDPYVCGGASAVEDVLRRNANDHLHVLVVWEPVLPMDWARPNRWVRLRINDPRVTQFWDKDHLVAKGTRTSVARRHATPLLP